MDDVPLIVTDEINLKKLLKTYCNQLIADIMQASRERIFVFSTLVSAFLVITKMWYPHLHETAETFAASYLAYKRGH